MMPGIPVQSPVDSRGFHVKQVLASGSAPSHLLFLASLVRPVAIAVPKGATFFAAQSAKKRRPLRRYSGCNENFVPVTTSLLVGAGPPPRRASRPLSLRTARTKKGSSASTRDDASSPAWAV